jgi:cyclophilin family peptidyl-prolyl cis-trans isomerase
VAKKSVQKRVQAKRDAEKALRKRQGRVRKIRIWISAAAAVALVFLVFLLFKSDKELKPTAQTTPTPTPTATGFACGGAAPGAYRGKQYSKAPAMTINKSKKYLVTMQTSCGTVKYTLDPKLAPTAVNNFVFLARAGFYDNTKIHRVVDNAGAEAIMQGGDPKGDGTGGPGYNFTIEKPPGPPGYAKGAVAMANSGGKASNGSQFFIVAREWKGLPHDYTLLGSVTDAASFDVLGTIVKLPGDPLPNGLGTGPNPPIYILKVTITET